MSYFSHFNYILYPSFTDTDSSKVMILQDITSRVIQPLSNVAKNQLFYTYTMRDGESPESISFGLYGTPQYYWTIMLINNKFDRFYDFPMSSTQFNDYIIEKYGSVAAAYSQHKYFIRLVDTQKSLDSSILDKGFFKEVPDTFSVGGVNYTYTTYPAYSNGVSMKYSQTMYDWEAEQNESKRSFLVIQTNYINVFVENFNRLISA